MSSRESARWTRTTFRVLPYSAPILFLLAIWHLATPVDAGPHAAYPGNVVRSLATLAADNSLTKDLIESLERVAVGFTLALAFGWSLGMLAGRIDLANRILRPLVEVVRPIPPIAWIPVAIMWIGVGLPAAALIIFLGAFFPIFTNVYFAAKEFPTSYLNGARSLGAGDWRVFTEVLVPGTLPATFLGARVGLGVAWMCVIAAEMIAAEAGVGYGIQIYRQLLLSSHVLAYMAVIAAVGLLMQFAVGILEYAFVPWKRSTSWWLFAFRAAKAKPTSRLPDPERNGEQTADLGSGAAGYGIEVKDLQFEYPSGTVVFDGFDLTLPAGETTAVVGLSGCGKSTLIYLIAGFQKSTGGSIVPTVHSTPAIGNGTRAVVFQDYSLFPWMRVGDQIAFGLRSRGINSAMCEQLVASLLAAYRLTGLQHQFPHQLSGGQKQRVAMARAEAVSPPVLLLDEPFGAVDSLTREILLDELAPRLEAPTVLLVTHNLDEAIFLSDRVIVVTGPPMRAVKEFCVPFPRPRLASLRPSQEFQDLRHEVFAAVVGQKPMMSLQERT